MEARVKPGANTPATVLHGKVARLEPEGTSTACILSDSGTILVSNFLAAHIRADDQIDVPLILDAPAARTEVYIHKTSGRHDLYQAFIGYAAQPKSDKREQLYVRAEVPQGRLGIAALYFPCEVLRDYFYVADRRLPWEQQKTLYQILRSSPSASPAELRLAFKLRELELRAEDASKAAFSAAERAFNILAHPELRACYEALLSNPGASPVLFPYGGFGSIIVLGDRARDGQTFFVSRIVSFLPESRQRRFRAPLRKFEFYSDRALYRDPRRKLEVLVDQSAMPIVWDPTWNQWKHFLTTKVEVHATFVEAGKYRHRRGEWQLVKWETALPSRLNIKLPANTAEQVETARKTYHRFGQFSDALDQIRERIAREPMEREDLQRICWDLGIPGDFDIVRITWRPDYDEFFYRQLCRRARRLYLFRDEYIFFLEAAAVVETPQLGHATYIFSKPSSTEAFLAAYIRTTKDDIRQNRGNVAELLGFLGRIIHGASPRAWLRELRSKIGERVDYAATESEEPAPGNTKTVRSAN
jgi:hypothetical protein